MHTLTDAELERLKRGTGPRGSSTRITCDNNAAERTPAEENFLKHLQRYKFTGKKQLWPSWQEVLALLKALGWEEPKG